MNIKTLLLRLLCRAAVLALVPACAVLADDKDTDSDFGNSVRNMVQQQIYDQHAAANPGNQPPAATDGERAAAVIKAYRTQASKSSTSMTTDVPIHVSAP